MAVTIEIEHPAERQYVVRLKDEVDVCDSWFTVDPAVLERLGIADRDEEAVVRRTAEFLVERQDVADFPDLVDLADVDAAYDDFGAYIGR
jgi:hypothetical protein